MLLRRNVAAPVFAFLLRFCCSRPTAVPETAVPDLFLCGDLFCQIVEIDPALRLFLQLRVQLSALFVELLQPDIVFCRARHFLFCFADLRFEGGDIVVDGFKFFLFHIGEFQFFLPRRAVAGGFLSAGDPVAGFFVELFFERPQLSGLDGVRVAARILAYRAAAFKGEGAEAEAVEKIPVVGDDNHGTVRSRRDNPLKR